MRPGIQLPYLETRTSVKEWKIAEIQDRTLFVKVKITTLADYAGRFHCAAVTPVAVVVVDSQGKNVIPLPASDSESAAENA